MFESHIPGNSSEVGRHLSQIATRWTTLVEANQGPSETSTGAQQRLITRYGPAIYCYLLASVGDPDAADDLMQEFALRLARGDFRRADPGRGRFRDFLKTSLYHLVVDHQRRRRKAMAAHANEAEIPAETPDSLAQADREFLAAWRAELLNRTWNALETWEQQTGQILYTVLKYRTDYPRATSAEMAAALTERIGKALNDNWVRKRLFLAREKFSELLVEEVAKSLESATPEELEQELIELDLHSYCRTALDARKKFLS